MVQQSMEDEIFLHATIHRKGDYMNREERIKLIKSMEYVARQCNSEEVFDFWLALGVADGDIPYSDLSVSPEEEECDYYTDDTVFADLMRVFLKLMNKAFNDGGLYCDGVVSKAWYKKGGNDNVI